MNRVSSAALPIRRRNQAGFTILEVLVASLLVGISMFAIVEAFNRGVFGVGEVEDYSLALSLSQEKMEAIQDTAYTSVTNEAKADVSGFTGFQREVIMTNPATDLKLVVVKTYYQVPNGENNVSLTTYVVNN